jgi:hypothetical protein
MQINYLKRKFISDAVYVVLKVILIEMNIWYKEWKIDNPKENLMQ